MKNESFTVYTLANKDSTRFLYVDGWFIYQTTDVLRKITTFENIIDARFLLRNAKEYLNNLGLVKVVSVYITVGIVRDEE